MYRVYVSISKLQPLVECLQENCGEESSNYAVLQDNFIKDLQELQKDFEKFSQMVETTIDLNQVCITEMAMEIKIKIKTRSDILQGQALVTRI